MNHPVLPDSKSQRPGRVWFWFPAGMLFCLVACLVDSAFVTTVCGMTWGNGTLELRQWSGAIEATLYHETHHGPTGGGVSFGCLRGARDQIGITSQFLPRVDRSGPENPTPTQTWELRVPHLFLIAIYLAAWRALHVGWQRRKSRLLKLHSPP